MAFSDAFLRGQAITEGAKQDKMAGVRAIMGRSTRGSAIGYPIAGGGGGSTALDRVDTASRRVEEEGRRARKDEMAEDLHAVNMDEAALGKEIMERELAIMPSREDIRAQETDDAMQRAIDAELNVSRTVLAEGALRDSMDTQMRNRGRRKLSDGWELRNAEAMNEGLRSAMPGMESYARMTRADGTVTEEATGDAYPTFSDDGEGNVYVKWPGSDREVPVEQGDINQLMLGSATQLEQKVGTGTVGKGAAAVKTGGVNVAAMTPEQQGDYLINKQKANNDTFKTAIDFAEAKGLAGGGMMGGEGQTPDAWLKDFAQGLSLMSTPKVQEEIFGLRPTKPAMQKRATPEMIAGVAQKLQDAVEDGDVAESDVRRRVKQIAATFDQNFGWEASKMWMLSQSYRGLPEGLVIPGKSAESTPDFGLGTDTVLHYSDKDIGFAIDQTLGHAKIYNKDREEWVQATPGILRSFKKVLQAKIKIDGDDVYRPLLKEVEKKLMGLSGKAPRESEYELPPTGQETAAATPWEDMEEEPVPPKAIGAAGRRRYRATRGGSGPSRQ